MSQQQEQPTMEADKMLDVYIRDYLVKRKLDASTKAFEDEAKVPQNLTAIEAPRGFLFEWWTIFWDTFITRYKRQQGVDESGSEVQNFKAQRQQQQGGQYQHQSATSDAITGRNPRSASASASRKQPITKERYGNNVGLVTDPTNSMNLPPIRHQKPVPIRGTNSLMRPLMNPGAAGPDCSMIGVPGATRPLTNLPLKGWPLTGLDQIQPGFHQQQQSLVQLPQLSHQLQMESSLLLQAQQNSTSSSATDIINREIRFLLNCQNNVSIGKCDRTLTHDGLQVPVGLPLTLPKQLENVNQHHQQFPYHSPHSGHESPHSNYALVSSSIEAGPSLLKTSPGDDQAVQHQYARKRKQPLSSSGLASGSGTVNAAGLSSCSVPSTPSTHTVGDVASIPSFAHNDKMQMDDFLNEHLDADNTNTLIAHAGADPSIDAVKGFIFSEVGSIQASAVNGCHFSFDGKLVATGGQDKKARLWCIDSRENYATLDEHSEPITDVCFSPSMLRLATSSHDKTIKIWDVENLGHSLRTFTGHTTSVLSVDFHPKNEDLICSCDESEIRYWTIKNAGCVRVAKGGANQVRFQHGVGKYLAAVVGNSISIKYLENPRACRHLLKGHTANVQSICWDFSGERLASVSEDLVRVWKMDSGEEENCIHELSVAGKRFRCAAFHPGYPSLLIIGCHQSLELWDMAENKMMTPLEEPTSTLAVSKLSGLIASAGHNDNLIKLWK